MIRKKSSLEYQKAIAKIESAAQSLTAVIAFTEVEDPLERTFIKQAFKDYPNLLILKETANEVLDKISKASVLSIFIKSKIDKYLFNQMPQLRFVTTRSTGFDHIDLKTAKKRDIRVSNVPTYGENTVAEHTFALILSLSRNLRKAYLRTVRNDFSIEGLMGFDLKGKTLGVIGTGHIGLHVIRIGTGFGMNVLAFDVQEKKFLSEVMGFRYVPLKELLNQSDIISLHVPFLPATKHLINQKNICDIKRGAILINTARGGLVETEALVKALNDGILAGAGLDVLEEEEFILEENRLLKGTENQTHWNKLQTVLGNHVLLHRENVIYTPHMAFYSREAVERILETTATNIKSFLAGHTLNEVA